MTLEPANRRLAVRWLPVASLKVDPRNARLHSERQVAAIAESIAAFGFNVPLIVDGEGRVMAGHGRLIAARRLGLVEVPTIAIEHLNEAQRRAFMIADNRLSELGQWDRPKLALELDQLKALDPDFALSAIGFEASEIDPWLNSRAAVADRGHDAGGVGLARRRARPPVARAGDAWTLGPGRLVCGEGALDAFSAIDAAIERWQAASGESARLAPAGEIFAAVARARAKGREAGSPRP